MFPHGKHVMVFHSVLVHHLGINCWFRRAIRAPCFQVNDESHLGIFRVYKCNGIRGLQEKKCWRTTLSISSVIQKGQPLVSV